MPGPGSVYSRGPGSRGGTYHLCNNRAGTPLDSDWDRSSIDVAQIAATLSSIGLAASEVQSALQLLQDPDVPLLVALVRRPVIPPLPLARLSAMMHHAAASITPAGICRSQANCSVNCCQNCPLGLLALLVGVAKAKQLCKDGIKDLINDFATAWTNSGLKFTGSLPGVPKKGDLRYKRHKFGDRNYQVHAQKHSSLPAVYRPTC